MLLLLCSPQRLFHVHSVFIRDIWTLPAFSSSFSLPGVTLILHVVLTHARLCECTQGGWKFWEKAAWHFWLVKLNMWQAYLKADLHLSFARLAFKSTNAHLQLLLPQVHLLWKRAHAWAGTFNDLLLQGSPKENVHFFIDQLIKRNFDLNMLVTVVIQWCKL